MADGFVVVPAKRASTAIVVALAPRVFSNLPMVELRADEPQAIDEARGDRTRIRRAPLGSEAVPHTDHN